MLIKKPLFDLLSVFFIQDHSPIIALMFVILIQLIVVVITTHNDGVLVE